MSRRLATIIGLAFVALLATLAAQESTVEVSPATVRWSAACTGSWRVDSFGQYYCWDNIDPHQFKRWAEERERDSKPWQMPTQLKTASGGQGTSPMLQWQTECNCLSADGCCSQDAAISQLPGSGMVCLSNPPQDCGRRDLGISTAGTGSITITPGPTTLAAAGLKVHTTYLGLPCGPAFPMPGCLPPEMQGWLVQIEGGDAPHFDVTLIYADADGRRHAHTQECVPRSESYQGKPPFTAVPFRTGRAKMPPWFPEGTTIIRTEAWPSKPGCGEP